MENILLIAIILFCLEIIEAIWQKGGSFKEIVKNLYFYYNNNPILFFIRHFSLYYCLFIMISLNIYNLLLISIIIVKFIDISIKLYIFDKINNNDKNFLELFFSQDMEVSNRLKFLNVIIYPVLLFISLMEV
ncbi:MAG: hypothetical protein HXX81_04275 [Campylobacterales bacterium]|nr:hypothetical protein [Campylobacterales bacterium]